jgi:hypothetical protein
MLDKIGFIKEATRIQKLALQRGWIIWEAAMTVIRNLILTCSEGVYSERFKHVEPIHTS